MLRQCSGNKQLKGQTRHLRKANALPALLPLVGDQSKVRFKVKTP